MSDLREAFEAWAVDYTRGWYSINEFNEDVLKFAWEAWQAALQSAQGEVSNCDGCAAGMPLQHVDPKTLRPHMRCTASRYTHPAPAADGGEVEPVAKYAANEIRSVLTGMIHWKDGEWAEHGPERLAAVAAKLDELYTHPAQSRNEVQAEALEEFANDMKGLAERNRNLKTAGGVLVASQEAEAKAKRLRSNGGDV